MSMAKGKNRLSVTRRLIETLPCSTSTYAQNTESEFQEEGVLLIDEDDDIINNSRLCSHSPDMRRIPQDNHHEGGLPLAFQDSSSGELHTRLDSVARAAVLSPRRMAASGPINVPDWRKMLLHDGFDDHESEMVPPHEYLARVYATSKTLGGASVFEGVGRTLKGRDMRRVRDAVWSQTGFHG